MNWEMNDDLDDKRIGYILESFPRYSAPPELVRGILGNAGAGVQRSVWDAAKWTALALWKVASHGCSVDDELANLLRMNSPAWVARWVLYV